MATLTKNKKMKPVLKICDTNSKVSTAVSRRDNKAQNVTKSWKQYFEEIQEINNKDRNLARFASIFFFFTFLYMFCVFTL